MSTPSTKLRSPVKTPNSSCDSLNNLSTFQLKELISKISVKKKKPTTDYISYAFLAIVIGVTVLAFPEDFFSNNLEAVKLSHVFYYGWITAISTGLGVIPFFFFDEPNKFWMAVSNAVAGGMMISASYSLAMEGAEVQSSTYADSGYPYDITVSVLTFLSISEVYVSAARTIVGFAIGVLFILVMQHILEAYQDLKVGDFAGASAQKMILIMFVMTLHSLSEGIGIGVSFGGSSGAQLGQFISLSLAVHNVPEGLAVALVLTSRKVSKLRTVLWAIFTSLPQPFTAIPAFIFVEKFAPLLPLGLGFAAGAMTYVAIFELLAEAVSDSNILITAITGGISCLVMNFLQNGVKGAL
jgi:ZIP family zinc transporter